MKLLQRSIIALIILCVMVGTSLSTQYFVSTTGNDTNIGTQDLPFATIYKAISIIRPGDTIFVRGGTYIISNTSYIIKISSTNNGVDTTRRNCLFAYAGERPILDFSSMGTPRVSSSNDGIRLSGKYWYIKGFDIKGAQHNGIAINGGSYNIVENCAMYENRNTGLQIDNGASYNRIINCDSYYNRDSTSASNYDGNADGFSPKLQNGTLNYFYGCRSWQNSDDGWDGYVRPASPVAGKDTMKTIIENCWCFTNGYLKNGNVGTGNGNGFKMGGGDKDAATNTISNADSLRHNMTLINCLSFNNKVKGFDQNNNRGTMTLINCTGYANGTYNFSVPGFIRVGQTLTLKNCISLASSGVTLSGVPNPILATNSWSAPFSGAANADFISIDTTGVRGPRKPDGSLPDITFMHLAPGSQFIDAGTDVGLPFNGSAPDLGCFETDGSVSVHDNNSTRIFGFQLSQNYPNPFNPSTKIIFSVGMYTYTSLRVYDVLGREVAILVNEAKSPGIHSIIWNAERMPSGIYFCRLESNGKHQIIKMILMK